MNPARVLAGVVALAAVPARAADAEPPHDWTVEVALSGYRPRIDAEFGGSASPYATVFGNGRAIMFRADAGRVIWRSHGALEVALGAGYFERYGHGLLEDGSRSADSTALRVVPTRASLTYRFEILQELGVPVSPYGRFALERYWWWVDNGSGSTASYGGRAGRGATNGWSAAVGLSLMLDFLDPIIAPEMRRESSIRHVAAFVEASRTYIDDFGSSRSWDLSNDRVTLSVGIALMF